MKKAIIHIGGHKTGSTAIQKSLFSSSSLLRELKICYPLEFTCQEISFFGQHSLVWNLLDRDGSILNLPQEQIDCAFENFCRFIKGVDSDLLMSSEDFSWLNDNAISRFTKTLVDFDIYVVMYVRRQDDAALALYQTDVIHAGQTEEKFIEWLNARKSVFDYFSIAERWSKLTSGKVIVRQYNRERLKNGDIVNDFEQVLNDICHKKITLIKSDETPNATIPASITSLIRYYNAQPIKDKIVPSLKRLGNEFASLKTTKYFQLVEPSVRKSIIEEFRKNNLALSKKYLGLQEVFFSDAIIETDSEWQRNNCFGDSDLLALVHEMLDFIANSNNKPIHTNPDIDDKQADVFRNEALIFIKSEKWDAALEKLKLAHSIRPHGPYIRILLIQALVQLKQFSEISSHLDFLKNPPRSITEDVSLNNLLNQLRLVIGIVNNFDAIKIDVINNDTHIHAVIKTFGTLMQLDLCQVKDLVISLVDNAKQNLTLNEDSRLEQSIPKITHRLWLTDIESPHEPPFDFIERYLNNLVNAYPPDWQHCFWIQDEALIPATIEFMQSKNIQNLSVKHFRKELSAGNWINLLDALIKDKKFVFAGDILRIKIMDEVGGVYCDLGVNFLPGYIDYLTKCHDYVFIYWDHLFFQNGLLAMKPNNELCNYFMKITESPYIVPKEMVLDRNNNLNEGLLFSGPMLTVLLLDMAIKKHDLKLCLVHPKKHLLNLQSNQSWYEKDTNGTAKFGNAYIPDSSPSFINEKMFDDYEGLSIFDLIEPSETK